MLSSQTGQRTSKPSVNISLPSLEQGALDTRLTKAIEATEGRPVVPHDICHLLAEHAASACLAIDDRVGATALAALALEEHVAALACAVSFLAQCMEDPQLDDDEDESQLLDTTDSMSKSASTKTA